MGGHAPDAGKNEMGDMKLEARIIYNGDDATKNRRDEADRKSEWTDSTPPKGDTGHLVISESQFVHFTKDREKV
jgi:hypothetical protein